MASICPSHAILDHFAALRDPRQQWRVLYPLPEILLLVLCATLCGMDDFVETRLWGEERLDFLRRFLPFERGIPAHDTLNDVVNALDPDLFKACFANWVETLRDGDPEIVAIDGKTSRRTHDRGRGRGPLHLVSAWASRQRLVLGQEAVDTKSNEITATLRNRLWRLLRPLLLERLQLKGALVTIDAIGTQAAIAETVVRKGGDYLLALKANRPATHTDVAAFFADPPPGTVEEPYETTDNDHGRLERRRHLVCHKVDWLLSDRRYPDEPRFPLSPPSPWSRPEPKGLSTPVELCPAFGWIADCNLTHPCFGVGMPTPKHDHATTFSRVGRAITPARRLSFNR